MKTDRNKKILMAGYFLSEETGVRGFCKDLSVHLEQYSWTVIRTSSSSHRITRLCCMLFAVLRYHRLYIIAYVEVYSGLAFIWADIVCQMLHVLGKPYVLTLHGGNFPVYAKHHRNRVMRLLNSAAAVTVPSRYLLVKIRKYKSEIILIPNAIDLKNYEYRIRKIPQPKLIWMRSFHQLYNPILAVDVVSMLMDEFQNIRLNMIGYDRNDGSLKATIKRAQILLVENRISFLGGVVKKQVPNQLNKGDIFINTANVDNTPISVLEAMACGLCVISTNVGGMPYLLENEKDALLVPPNNPIALANAVRRILNDPKLAMKLSSNARKKVEHLDWSKVMPLWDELLKEIIMKKR